ncbi:MAG: hypothetical protein ACOX4M_07465 [Acetivibrionales bacterium]|jgi:hypothetical protein
MMRRPCLGIAPAPSMVQVVVPGIAFGHRSKHNTLHPCLNMMYIKSDPNPSSLSMEEHYVHI